MANPPASSTQTERGQLIRDDSMASVGYNYKSIVAATPTTTVVKSGPGFLHAIDFTATADGVITIYDNTAASGTKIRTITSPSTLLQSEHNKLLDITFNTGLTIVTSGAAQDIVVAYV